MNNTPGINYVDFDEYIEVTLSSLKNVTLPEFFNCKQSTYETAISGVPLLPDSFGSNSVTYNIPTIVQMQRSGNINNVPSLDIIGNMRTDGQVQIDRIRTINYLFRH